MVKTVSSLRDLRMALETWRSRDETVSYVPTMGSLHEGHLALIHQAQSLGMRVVVSIFVHPALHADYERMANDPAQRKEDEQLLTRHGCDLLYRPTLETLFPPTEVTRIDPGPLGNVLEGEIVPDNFQLFATIMAKLLMHVQSDYACIGEKNFQELRITEQLAQDLFLPVSIVPVPIMREEDGVPYSCRNRFLTPEERAKARILPETLEATAMALQSGLDIEASLIGARAKLEQVGMEIDYFALVNTRTLTPAKDLRKNARLLAAVRLGQARLIDNYPV